MNIEVTRNNLAFLECFSSATRIQIIEMLNLQPMNIKDIAKELGFSSAIVTKHIQKMENAGIVTCQSVAGIRGMQKICSLSVEQVSLTFKRKKKEENQYHTSIPVGQYSSFQVKPTCGLASQQKIIGMVDDPRYFADPEHVKANHIWFAGGWVEYCVPNFLLSNQFIHRFEISLELCSEAPGYNENWPSDITFLVNDIPLGVWTCPGDYGTHRGAFTPDWWGNRTQHGLMKTVTINQEGSFIDGKALSNVRIPDLQLAYGKEIYIKIASLESAKNYGGISLFGKNFGNYNQDIEVTLRYT